MTRPRDPSELELGFSIENDSGPTVVTEQKLPWQYVFIIPAIFVTAALATWAAGWWLTATEQATFAMGLGCPGAFVASLILLQMVWPSSGVPLLEVDHYRKEVRLPRQKRAFNFCQVREVNVRAFDRTSITGATESINELRVSVTPQRSEDPDQQIVIFRCAGLSAEVQELAARLSIELRDGSATPCTPLDPAPNP